MKFLVIIKQRIKYTQEQEYRFDDWTAAVGFVHCAMCHGDGITVEIMEIEKPEDPSLPTDGPLCETIDDTDFND